MEGSALHGTMTGGALPIELAAEFDSDADRETLTGLVQDAIAAAPINGLLRGVHHSVFSLTRNGARIGTRRVRSIEPMEPDPAALFERARPAPGDWSDLVARAGLTPKTEEATSNAGSSYQEHQTRRLHVRGICTLRPDGIKVIEQHLYNPHGSIFRFLSEEGAADGQGGGQGRSPDALSYIAAGIAFCFMAQLGRYAKISQSQLDDCRVVQDMHFSPGPRSTADAVDTYVYLRSPEDDAFA